MSILFNSCHFETSWGSHDPRWCCTALQSPASFQWPVELSSNDFAGSPRQIETKNESKRHDFKSLEISWEMPSSVAANVSWQLFGLFGLCKELLGGKAQNFKGETCWDLDDLQHLPPPLEHSPTLQNSNNTKQYNTYIPQSTRQSTKQSSKKHTTINDTKANKQKQQYRTAYRQQQRQTTNSSRQSAPPFNNIPPSNTAKPQQQNPKPTKTWKTRGCMGKTSTT